MELPHRMSHHHHGTLLGQEEPGGEKVELARGGEGTPPPHTEVLKSTRGPLQGQLFFYPTRKVASKGHTVLAS